MGVYRLEVAKGGRAGCKSPICKGQVKIQKGEFRYGTQVEIQEHLSWQWRHWGCVTPQQITNLNETIDGNLEYLDGYDEIPEDLQEKVRTALEQGHVADEDWRGDTEMNRAGKKGMTIKTPKKAAQPHETTENGEPSPSKPAKKSSRAKKEPEGSEDGFGSPPEKAKGKRKRTMQPTDTAAVEEPQEPLLKKTRGRAKKVKDEDLDENLETQGPARKKVSTQVKKVKQEDSDGEVEPEDPAPKMTKGKTNLVKQEEDDENTAIQATAGKKEKGNAKSAKQDMSNEAVGKRVPAPRAAKNKAKEVKTEEAMENETDIEDPAKPNGEHDESVEPAKAKRTRKKPNNSQASTGSKGRGKKS